MQAPLACGSERGEGATRATHCDPDTQWVKTADGWRAMSMAEVSSEAPSPHANLASSVQIHGCCYGFEQERDSWASPRQIFSSDKAARPGYDTADASEYLDEPAVLEAKVTHVAELIRRSTCTVVYAGAGLSTAAGIEDYATYSRSTAQAHGQQERLKSPMCAQPTLSHRALVGLNRAGLLHRLVQQNHDGLPQKAGMPQEALNEIHGSLYAPDNPVIAMSGTLRGDLLRDLLDAEARADLVLCVGTSLAGMNADRIVHSAAQRAADGKALGAVLVGLQRTRADAEATIRIFAPCDVVFQRLADLIPEAARMMPEVRPSGEFFAPPFLTNARPAACGDDGKVGESIGGTPYHLTGLPYDAMGRRVSTAATCRLDVRDDARLVIPSGPYAGAQGVVDGTDREGHPRCRFQLRLKPGKPFKALMLLTVGVWWLQAAIDATVDHLPVVNPPDASDASEAAEELRSLMATY
jgi:NAD-dependent SIR2 family protein deacetylase